MGRPLRQLRPSDPFVRWVLDDLSPDEILVVGANIAFVDSAETAGEVWITCLGEDPGMCARLVEQLASTTAVDGITVPEEAFGLLPARLQSPDHGHWSFWVYDPDLAPIGDSDAIDLTSDDPRIAPLLAHSDSAHVFPGDPRVVRWVGVIDGERLVSVAAQRTESSGAAHIVSVCTDPQRRGEGLARRACTRIMRLATDEGAPAVILEMYAGNEAGRRTYSALGFREVGRFRSGLLSARGHRVPA